MRKFLLVLLWLLSSCFSTHVLARDPTVPILNIAQDSQGTHYFATPMGVQRYDVDQIESIQPQLIDAGVEAQWVQSLLILDNDDQMIGTDRGMYWVSRDGKVQGAWLKGETIRVIQPLDNERFLVGTNTDLFELNILTGEHKSHIAGTKFSYVILDGDNVLVGALTGLYASSRTTLDFEKILDVAIRDILATPDGTVVLSDPYTYLMGNDQNDDFVMRRLDSSADPIFMRAALGKNSKVIWLSTEQNTIELRSFPGFKKLPHTITRNPTQINRLITDEFGNLWVGSARGLERYQKATIKNQPNGKNNRLEEVFVAAGPDGTTILCTLGNITQIDGQAEHVLLDQGDPLLKLNPINGCKVKNGDLFVATLRGLIRIDLATHQAGWFATTSDGPIKTKVLSINDGPTDNTLVLGISNGVMVVSVGNQPETIAQWGQGEVAATVPLDRQRIAWVERCAEGSKIMISALKGKPWTLATVEKLYAPVVRAVASGGNIWLATFGQHVFKVSLSGGRVSHYGQDRGLPSGLITAITEDRKRRIVVTSRDGIALLSPGSQFFRQVGDSKVYSPGSVDQATDGRIVAAGPDGLSSWTLEDIEAFDRNYPTINISRAQGRDTTVNPTEITANYGESLNVMAFPSNLLAQDTVEVMFDGQGENPVWTKVVKNAVHFPLGKSGSYSMLVRVPGVPESLRKIPVSISGPWWQTVIFYLVISLGVVVVAGSIYLKRQRFSLKSDRKRLELVNGLLKECQTDYLKLKIKIADVFRYDFKEDIEKATFALTEATYILGVPKTVDSLINEAREHLNSLLKEVGENEELYVPLSLRKQSLTAALVKITEQMETQAWDNDDPYWSQIDVDRPDPPASDDLSLLERLGAYDAISALLSKFYGHAVPVRVQFPLSPYIYRVTFLCDGLRLQSLVGSDLESALSPIHAALNFQRDRLVIDIVPTQARAKEPTQPEDNVLLLAAPSGSASNGLH